MEAKRTNAQPMHKTASRLSTTKNQGNAAAAKEGVTPSKTEVLKTGSQASLTPSQAAELAKQNERKNPLDVLSRTALRQTFERRSGLQDVDEEFLKNNVFSRKLNPRHMGLDNYSRVPPVAMPAGIQSVPSTEIRNRGGGNTGTSGVVEAAGVPTSVSPSRSQLKTPPQQQQEQAPAQGDASAGSGQAKVQSGQAAKQQNQANHQRPAAGISSHGNNNASAPNPTPSQCKIQSNANANNNNNQQQQSNGIQGQQQQNSPRQSAGGDNGVQREPDMCTTCPNCQTTIYLVRPNDNEMASTAGGQQNYYQQEPMQGLAGHSEVQAVSASGN